jgi:predicted nuclease with TOPRIM domain
MKSAYFKDKLNTTRNLFIQAADSGQDLTIPNHKLKEWKEKFKEQQDAETSLEALSELANKFEELSESVKQRSPQGISQMGTLSAVDFLHQRLDELQQARRANHAAGNPLDFIDRQISQVEQLIQVAEGFSV